MIFRARQFQFVFPRPALIMGVVNVTPDSFSDGGQFMDPAAAVTHGIQLARQGAEILDIGGESTRPGARPVDEEEELRRVVPVIKKLAAALKRGKAPAAAISIDTMKPAVARAALEAGASMVNDVAANRHNGDMWNIVSEFQAGYVVTHSPPGLHRPPGRKRDIVRETFGFFSERLEALTRAHMMPEQVLLDPGIGFGKSLEENLKLLASLHRFARLRRPLLLGVSRKSFIEKLFGAKVNERLPASLACAILGVESGACIIRTHDAKDTVQAIRMAEAVLARERR